MKALPIINTAAAISFAAGIALAGTGNRAPTRTKGTRETDSERTSTRGGARKIRPASARTPIDPTLAHASFARALTSARGGSR